MKYASRDWKAVETTDPVGSKHVLTVTGEVEVRKSNEEPKLTEAQPQGINPATLILDLVIEGASEIGGDVLLWKPVAYVRDISSRQYRDVTIKGETDGQTVPVVQILS